MEDDYYNLSLPSYFFMYYEVYNLYGIALCHPLYISYSDRLEDNLEYHMEHISKMSDDMKIGYLLEVNLNYAIELQELHKDL